MTRTEARQLLDAARDGQDVPVHVITLALRVSGDLASYRNWPRLVTVDIDSAPAEDEVSA